MPLLGTVTIMIGLVVTMIYFIHGLRFWYTSDKLILWGEGRG